ncbi:MAG: protein phosphatase 2C domain-containing protein [bacterium]|nr:protein phosphatase 2C domain-containing protein [bacterium]
MAGSSPNFADAVEHAAISDIGMRRKNNQDAFSIALANDAEQYAWRGHLFVVADGMGAHAAGELASKLSADNIPHLYHKYAELPPHEALLKAVEETNALVYRRGEANSDFHNMGTTCSSLLLLPQGVVLAHVGDSRIYRQRGSGVDQLTFDHSLVWELRANGQVNAAVPKNVITRSLGPNPTVQADLEGPFPAQVGDTYLLCSDGLTGKVDDEEIACLLKYLPPERSAQFLVDLANLRGGPDNITVIILRISDESHATAPDATAIGGGKPAEPTSIHPAVWAVIAACLLAAVVMGFMQLLIPAAACLAVAVTLVLYALYANTRTPDTTAGPSAHNPLGKGPHTHAEAIKPDAMCQRLTDVLSQLEDAAREADWNVEWRQIETLKQKAAESTTAGDHESALSKIASCISYLMDEAKNQRDRKKSDSSIDLV